MRGISFQQFFFCLACVLVFATGCSTLPQTKHKWYKFPEGKAFIQSPGRAYEVIGTVKSTVNFSTLDENNDEQKLCNNYFNRAVEKLVEYAEKEGGQAVVEVRSVVFFVDGKSKTYDHPECSDDGSVGQILATGQAVKWK